jgi:hypothetical protein
METTRVVPQEQGSITRPARAEDFREVAEETVFLYFCLVAVMLGELGRERFEELAGKAQKMAAALAQDRITIWRTLASCWVDEQPAAKG